MKYYIYISDTKVDMLYPQISKSLLKRLASDLSINLTLFGAGANIKAKSDETRYSKLRIVTEYIEKHLDVGSIDSPGTYFKGTLPMQYAFLRVDRLVYFGGTTARTIMGLGGSPKHVIGATLPEKQDRVFGSLMAYFMTVFDEINESLAEEEVKAKTSPGNVLDDVVRVTQKELTGPKQQLEFLAKTFLQGPLQVSSGRSSVDKERYVVLGSPIYVAMDD